MFIKSQVARFASVKRPSSRTIDINPRGKINEPNAVQFVRKSPKRALMNFLESLGGHNQPKPIHHYHMHYYPIPVPLVVPKPAPPPPKIEIDLSSLHSGHDHRLRSLPWASRDYGKIHEPEIVLPSPQSDPAWHQSPDAWADSSLQHKSWADWDNNEILEKDHAYKEVKPPGILLQVPLKQQIVLYQPPAKDTKSSLLSTLFKKIRRLNDALFHPEEEPVEHHDNTPHITNSLTYAAS